MKKLLMFVVGMAIVATATASFAQDDEPPGFSSLVRPVGTIYCNIDNLGEGRSAIRSVPMNDPINLRRGPGLNYPIIDNFDGGAGRIVARYQNWFGLEGYRDSPYTMGWFHGKYINVARLTPAQRACLRLPPGYNPR